MFAISNASGGYSESPVIRKVALTVEKNEVVAILGRNGTGKTTLMKYIMAMLPVSAGTVSLDGKTLPEKTAGRVKAGIGYVPQGRFVFPRMTVVENIAVAAVACKQNAKETIESLFSDFPLLSQRAKQLAGSLSGGQQQILAMARALATKPRLLLLDEPSEGIQPSIVDEIAEMLLSLNQRQNMTILLAEQNLDFSLDISSRAYIMDGGTIVQSATKQELMSDKKLLQRLLGV